MSARFWDEVTYMAYSFGYQYNLFAVCMFLRNHMNDGVFHASLGEAIDPESVAAFQQLLDMSTNGKLRSPLFLVLAIRSTEMDVESSWARLTHT